MDNSLLRQKNVALQGAMAEAAKISPDWRKVRTLAEGAARMEFNIAHTLAVEGRFEDAIISAQSGVDIIKQFILPISSKSRK